MAKVGVLHPGQMGCSVGAALLDAGNTVYWVAEGRSDASVRRAEIAGLSDAGSLNELCSRCETIFSICPPEHSESVAASVIDSGYTGTFVDCNAVSPATAQRTGKLLSDNGAQFVDGGIIGLPVHRAGSTRLYLSGENATDVQCLFENSMLDAKVIGSQIDAASALKMAYAGWTKGSAALLMTMFAFAESSGVAEELLAEWDLSQPGLKETLSRNAVGTAPKAWRFVGEMNEIAASLDDANLPREWFEGAADIYSRLAQFKDSEPQEKSAIIKALLDQSSS